MAYFAISLLIFICYFMPVDILISNTPPFGSLTSSDLAGRGEHVRRLIALGIGGLPFRWRLLWNFAGSSTRRVVSSLFEDIADSRSVKDLEEQYVYWERRHEASHWRWKVWHRRFIPACDFLAQRFEHLLAVGFPRIGRVALKAFVGDSVSLMVMNGASSSSIQWQQNGVNVPGGTLPLLQLPHVEPSSAGVYRVVTRSAEGIDISNEVTLQVSTHLAPVVIKQPYTCLTRIGESWGVSVEAEGVGDLQYMWHFNGQPLPGACEPTLQIRSVAPHNLGIYRLQIRNAHGITNTADIVLSLDAGTTRVGT